MVPREIAAASLIVRPRIGGPFANGPYRKWGRPFLGRVCHPIARLCTPRKAVLPSLRARIMRSIRVSHTYAKYERNPDHYSALDTQNISIIAVSPRDTPTLFGFLGCTDTHLQDP